MFNITCEVGIIESGNSFLAMCHVFYSQADDVCQVYVFSSVHSVLAFAQMCKPAEGKPNIYASHICL